MNFNHEEQIWTDDIIYLSTYRLYHLKYLVNLISFYRGLYTNRMRLAKK